jgi:large subunit ribosomal protein L21
MFAVVSYKGNQYKVEPDKTYKFDLFDHVDEKKIVFSEILLVDDGKNVKVGTPNVEGASVEAEIIEDMKDKKVTATKFKAKKHYKRNLGHRQDYTLVKILGIKL